MGPGKPARSIKVHSQNRIPQNRQSQETIPATSKMSWKMMMFFYHHHFFQMVSYHLYMDSPTNDPAPVAWILKPRRAGGGFTHGGCTGDHDDIVEYPQK